MIPVKLQCDCGQRYVFDVEPVNGCMPTSVACPTCGADGTVAANERIAQALAAEAAKTPSIIKQILEKRAESEGLGSGASGAGASNALVAQSSGATAAATAAISAVSPPGVPVISRHLPPAPVRADVPNAVPAAAGGVKLNALAHSPSVPSASPPVSTAAPSPAAPAAARPFPLRPIQRPAAARGKDGWATPETSLNKLGNYVVVGPSALAALFAAGFLGVEIPTTILYIIVGIAGLIGGAMNIAGRGPILAGAFVGLVMALGGFATTYLWIHGRKSVYIIEATIAFVVGCGPGFLLQVALGKILQKRAGAGEQIGRI